VLRDLDFAETYIQELLSTGVVVDGSATQDA
jgi:hypothetical protein